MKATWIATAATGLALMTACVGNDGIDKGDEDDSDFDSKADSFAAPTAHGAVPFGRSSDAAFSDSQGFHTWTFKLTGNATTKLATSYADRNLDTVMYLYKKGATGWGAAIDKNDDANSRTLSSAFSKRLGAGEYRIIVKTFKRTQRGAFSLTSSCEGAGCPTTVNTCPAVVELPPNQGYGDACATSLAKIFANADIKTERSEVATPATRCALPALERQSLDYWRSYMAAAGGDTVEADYEIHTQVLGGTAGQGGTVVSVTDGGDESAMSLVYDLDGKLVMMFQHNQSPDLQFYCRGSAPARDVAQIEDCVDSLLNSVHGDQEASVNISARIASVPAATGQEVIGAMKHFAKVNAVAASASITANGAKWGGEWDSGARLTISAANKPVTSYLSNKLFVVLATEAGRGSQLVCEAQP